MKKAVMIGPSPLARGGMATVVKTLLEHGFDEDGRCVFIPTHVDGSALRKAGRAGAAFARFVAMLARGEVALLHVHVASGVSFWRKAMFIGAARACGRPVLFHLHGGEFRAFIDRLRGPRRRVALAAVGSAAAAFALTEASAAWLRAECGIARVEVFPNPLPAVPALPRTPGQDVLYIGRLEEKKGVFELLQSFAGVLAARPRARLVLAGDGDGAAVMARAAQLGVAASVHLAGWVDAQERARLLAAAAVFVLPSWHEQMPMVVLEAMAAGTPVVATGVGAIPDMLGHGKCGIVVAEHDTNAVCASILRIMDDNILAQNYSANGLLRVESEYSVESVLSRLRRRYEELAA